MNVKNSSQPSAVSLQQSALSQNRFTAKVAKDAKGKSWFIAQTPLSDLRTLPLLYARLFVKALVAERGKERSEKYFAKNLRTENSEPFARLTSFAVKSFAYVKA